MITKKIDEYLTEANKYNLYDDEDISKEEVKDAEKALGEYEKAIKGFKARLKALKPEFKNLLKLERSISKKYGHLGVDDSDVGIVLIQEKNRFDAIMQALEWVFD